jgi:hypothetical protein
MWQHFCLTGRIIGKKNFNILMTHLKADVATFSHQPLNASLKY